MSASGKTELEFVVNAHTDPDNFPYGMDIGTDLVLIELVIDLKFSKQG